MEHLNESIRCDVCECEHNVRGRNCNLNVIKVSTDNTLSTCCESFEDKNSL